MLDLGAAAGFGAEAVSAFATSAAGVAAPATSPVVAGIPTVLGGTVGATNAIAQEILAATALVGGVSGIVNSAENGDGVGTIAATLETAAALASGLVVSNNAGGNTALFAAIAPYLGIAGGFAAAADAFQHGSVANGLLDTLGPLLSTIEQATADGHVSADSTVATRAETDRFSAVTQDLGALGNARLSNDFAQLLIDSERPDPTAAIADETQLLNDASAAGAVQLSGDATILFADANSAGSLSPGSLPLTTPNGTNIQLAQAEEFPEDNFPTESFPPDPTQDDLRAAAESGDPALRSAAYGAAYRQLAALDPNNPDLNTITPPNWVPSPDEVTQLASDIADARAAIAAGYTPDQYRALAFDPDNGQYQTAERNAIVSAQGLGIVQGPVTRAAGGTGADYIDAFGQGFDLKQPNSIYPTGFNLQKLLGSVATDGAQGTRTLFDITDLSEADAQALRSALQQAPYAQYTPIVFTSGVSAIGKSLK